MTEKEKLQKFVVEFKQEFENWHKENGNRNEEESLKHSFWRGLLKCFGITHFDTEKPSGKKQWDFYVSQARVIIEQKASKFELRGEKDSGAFQQVIDYVSDSKGQSYPYYIITCNFKEINVYDCQHNNLSELKRDEPLRTIAFEDIPNEVEHLKVYFSDKNEVLKDIKNEEIIEEQDVTTNSKKAGFLIERLYNDLVKNIKSKGKSIDATMSHILNVFCVRVVFCLYAEDSNLFNQKAFGKFLSTLNEETSARSIRELFKVLAMKDEDRELEIDTTLIDKFPYVNGNLFTEDLPIPEITQEILDYMIKDMSTGFDWSTINPTVFGAIFESTLNQLERRENGMHYTSIENIDKVIHPLFMNDLREQYLKILNNKTYTDKTKSYKLEEFRNNVLGKIVIFDPACGSGNFLTQSYIELRRLENEIIAKEYEMEGALPLLSVKENIKVHIENFYGIELNDFAVSVAKTALWIAESQIYNETTKIAPHSVDEEFLPLQSNNNIVKGNALRLDWEQFVDKRVLLKEDKCIYIIGNPPFLGYSLQSKSQKNDILSIYVDENGKSYNTAGKIDYVSGWFWKAAKYMNGTDIKTAFVATNSITQGEQVASVWKPLFERFNIHIDFGYTTFKWNSESNGNAQVYCVIVGFSSGGNQNKKLYSNGKMLDVSNINAYLFDASDVFIESRKTPLFDVPYMTTGNRPADGGHLIIEEKDYDDFIKKEPAAKKYIKDLVGSEEFIHNKKRYCLWLLDVNPSELKKMPEVMKRIEACRNDRLNSPDEGRRKLADKSTLFRETLNPDNYLLIPKVSSDNRQYIPIGFMDGRTISTDLNFIVPNANLYHFGVLTSIVHMYWMRVVCGRLGKGYRYSKDIVYNNFPWATPTKEQKDKIEKTAQAILDVRAKYSNNSFADLYDSLTMPAELLKVHKANDIAVAEAYGKEYVKAVKNGDDITIIKLLFERYRRLVETERNA